MKALIKMNIVIKMRLLTEISAAILILLSVSAKTVSRVPIQLNKILKTFKTDSRLVNLCRY